MAVVFDFMLMERRPDKYVTSDEWRAWLQTAFAENRPLNTTVAQVLAANDIDDDGRHAAKFYLDRAVDKDVLVRAHNNYDSHMENFNFHLEQLGEFDRPFTTLIQDLDSRGMLEHTLVLLITEFGRTPGIQPDLGRDHWPPNWSVVLGGCGIQVGGVLGATNEKSAAIRRISAPRTEPRSDWLVSLPDHCHCDNLNEAVF